MPIVTPHARPERRISRPSPRIVGLAALAVAGLAFVTLCPIGLRPHLAPANEERFAAYFVLGILIALAAQRRWLAATACVVVLAFGLEAAQLLAPGRHAQLSDALVKAMSGALGSTTGQFIYPLKRLLRSIGAQPERLRASSARTSA